MGTTRAAELIARLQLSRHQEGGWFRETWRDPAQLPSERPGGTRSAMTSIYYLLTAERPIGYCHRNKSAIVHYFHEGDPITYLLIDHAGHLHREVLGPDHAAGHTRQLIVPGGWWKASVLEAGDYGLLGEAVAPGFEYQDMEFAEATTLQTTYPDHWPRIAPYVKQADG